MSSLAAVQADAPGSADASSFAVLTVILVSYLMIVLDISIVITALPRIRLGLAFSATGLSWVQNAYTLAFGGLLLLSARAGDIVGPCACSWPAWRCSRPPRWRSAWRSRLRG